MKSNGAEYGISSMIKMMLYGEVAFCDDYVEGKIKLNKPLYDFIKQNQEAKIPSLLPYRKTTSRAVEDHYNISSDFYQLFLDETMAYTCANFDGDETLSLEEAQKRKYQMHCDFLGLDDGLKHNLIDAGCGFGGLINHIVSKYSKVKATGVNISRVHIDYAKQMMGNHTRVRLINKSWEDHARLGRYDRFVTVGMTEHVGKNKLDKYFNWMSDITTNDAVGTIQFISMHKPVHNWIDKAVFPESYCPSLNEVIKLLKQNGMKVTDIIERGEDYAITCGKWLENLHQHWLKLKTKGYTDADINVFDLYLTACQVYLERGDIQLYQLRWEKC